MTAAIIAVAFDLKTNTIEITHGDESGARCACRNYHALQIGELREAAGDHAQRLIDFAGWTPEYVASVALEEKRKADEEQARLEAEENERKRIAKKAFDDAVAEQVRILEAAREVVKGKAK